MANFYKYLTRGDFPRNCLYYRTTKQTNIFTYFVLGQKKKEEEEDILRILSLL